MQYVIIDLEATCWKNVMDFTKMEIIEIGAVKLAGDTLEVLGEFSCFVRPVVNPLLSDFCKELTSIRQQDVDAAEIFKVVFPRLLAWIGEDDYKIVTWGNYDIKQFEIDCRRHGIELPEKFITQHINLKKEFAESKQCRPCGMKRALRLLDIPLTGTHHRGIDDARNIARIGQELLK
ncbi:MAG: exonuclease domain-containing protein [Candidatus Cloacimonetes bacterium]|nr:exonuclease domain-containing protein [Candidatus Cloacimonadota bacterium]